MQLLFFQGKKTEVSRNGKMRYSFNVDGVELVCEYTPPTRPHAIGTVCLATVLKPQTVALSDVSEPCSAGPNRKRGRKLAYFLYSNAASLKNMKLFQAKPAAAKFHYRALQP